MEETPIVHDAETREARSPGGPEKQRARETTSTYLGMTRKDVPTIDGEEPLAEQARERLPAVDVDNPAPLSTALGIPTLVKEPESPADDRGRQGAGSESGVTKSDAYVSSGLGLPLLSQNPTPLSSLLHVPTLINPSKEPPRR